MKFQLCVYLCMFVCVFVYTHAYACSHSGEKRGGIHAYQYLTELNLCVFPRMTVSLWFKSLSLCMFVYACLLVCMCVCVCIRMHVCLQWTVFQALEDPCQE